jgi:hypothetical protein
MTMTFEKELDLLSPCTLKLNLHPHAIFWKSL